MTIYTSPSAFAPLVQATGGTTTEGRLSSGCPAGLTTRLERVTRHAQTELRAAEEAVSARRANEIAQIHAREAAGAPGAETRALYKASYTRQQQGQAEVKAAYGLPTQDSVRKDAEAAARSAIAAVWERHIAQLEERFV